MIKKISVKFMAIGAVFLLASCAKEPPKCSDEETLSLVRQIFFKQIVANHGLSAKEMQDSLRFDHIWTPLLLQAKIQL